MLTFEEAKVIGFNACVDKLGRDFCRQYKDSAVTAYGLEEDEAYCFVGIDNRKSRYEQMENLVLTSDTSFPCRASCNVNLKTGVTDYLEVVKP